jgi:hypothetical protein
MYPHSEPDPGTWDVRPFCRHGEQGVCPECAREDRMEEEEAEFWYWTTPRDEFFGVNREFALTPPQPRRRRRA